MSFDVFDVFATSANETGNGYETVEMNSHVVNSPFTVGSFYWLERMHGLHRAAAFCKKEQLDKKKLNIACCMRTACDPSCFLCGKENRVPQ